MQPRLCLSLFSVLQEIGMSEDLLLIQANTHSEFHLSAIKSCFLCWINQISSQNMTSAYKKLLQIRSKTNHLTAYDQGEIYPVFVTYIGVSFAD